MLVVFRELSGRKAPQTAGFHHIPPPLVVFRVVAMSQPELCASKTLDKFYLPYSCQRPSLSGSDPQSPLELRSDSKTAAA